MYKKDLAYVSTATNYESTETFRGSKCCVLQITVSAGSKVLPVYLLSENESEDEILLDKGGNFIVTGSTMKDNMKIIFITYTSENCNIISDLNLKSIKKTEEKINDSTEDVELAKQKIILFLEKKAIENEDDFFVYFDRIPQTTKFCLNSSDIEDIKSRVVK